MGRGTKPTLNKFWGGGSPTEKRKTLLSSQPLSARAESQLGKTVGPKNNRDSLKQPEKGEMGGFGEKKRKRFAPLDKEEGLRHKGNCLLVARKNVEMTWSGDSQPGGRRVPIRKGKELTLSSKGGNVCLRS